MEQDFTYKETKGNNINNKENLILRRFKCRILEQIPNQSWVKPPPEWQLLKTEGGNVVWNNTKLVTATKKQYYDKGDEVWVVTGWKAPVQDALDPADMFDREGSGTIPIYYEPRMWVDAEQHNTYYPEYPAYNPYR